MKGEMSDTVCIPLRWRDVLQGQTQATVMMQMHAATYFFGIFQVFLSGNERPEIVPKRIQHRGRPATVTAGWTFVFTVLAGHRRVAIDSRICQIGKHFATDEKSCLGDVWALQPDRPAVAREGEETGIYSQIVDHI